MKEAASLYKVVIAWNEEDGFPLQGGHIALYTTPPPYRGTPTVLLLHHGTPAWRQLMRSMLALAYRDLSAHLRVPT